MSSTESRPSLFCAYYTVGVCYEILNSDKCKIYISTDDTTILCCPDSCCIQATDVTLLLLASNVDSISLENL